MWRGREEAGRELERVTVMRAGKGWDVWRGHKHIVELNTSGGIYCKSGKVIQQAALLWGWTVCNVLMHSCYQSPAEVNLTGDILCVCVCGQHVCKCCSLRVEEGCCWVGCRAEAVMHGWADSKKRERRKEQIILEPAWGYKRVVGAFLCEMGVEGINGTSVKKIEHRRGKGDGERKALGGAEVVWGYRLLNWLRHCHHPQLHHSRALTQDEALLLPPPFCLVQPLNASEPTFDRAQRGWIILLGNAPGWEWRTEIGRDLLSSSLLLQALIFFTRALIHTVNNTVLI